MTSELLPSQPPLRLNLTPDEIIALAKRTAKETDAVEDLVISSVTPEYATFDNVLLPLALHENEMNGRWHRIYLFNGVSPDPKVREAGKEALQILSERDIKSLGREDLFVLIQAVKQKAQDLHPESQKYLEERYNSLIRGGMGLSPEKRDRLKELRHGIQQCLRSFTTNLAESNHDMWLTKEELDGVPDSTIQGLETNSDNTKFRLTFKQPDVQAILRSAHSSAVRKRVWVADSNIATENVAVFKECLLLRDEMSRMLGYKHFVEYALVERMAESKESIETFLNNLQNDIQQPAMEFYERLQDMKRADVGSKDETLYRWDTSYYSRIILEKEYKVDNDKIAEYFPAESTIRGMLDIFEKLFGITILEHNLTQENQELIWHPEVKMFQVWNNDLEGGEFLGYLYTDIYPRDGKYNHNANFNIDVGYKNRDGQRHYPSTSLICNLNSPSSSRPSLLLHRQVITLFHELGHAMHCLLSKTLYSRFHGWSCARDFGEMPSQMLEHWCWLPEAIKSLSRHYSYLSPEYRQDWLDRNPDANGELPPETIPTEMIDSLIVSKNVTLALEQIRQVALSKFDMTVYGQPTAEESASLNCSFVYNKTMADTTNIPGPEALGEGYEAGHDYIRTNHFIQSNQACYYGYLFSRVFSADLFHTTFEKDPFNSEAGRHYRHMVLEKGGSQDEMKTLTDFLGRPPNTDGFRKEFGI